ncbi:MAG: DUF4307 domain-containing protein [Actinomycetota bacterium]
MSDAVSDATSGPEPDQRPEQGTDFAKIVVIAIGALLTAAIATIIVWSSRSGSGHADVHGRVSFVDIINDRQVAVTVEVEKAPLAQAECDVSAFDAKGISVGRLTGVIIGPNTTNQRTMTKGVVVLTPLGKAASAQVATCKITRTR